jgi:hypothetical protein
MSHYKGSCLGGGVTFEIEGDVRDVLACHCIQCRKTTGNYMSATACEEEQLRLTSDETLAWYESTPGHKRGFCNRCGSSLFWKPDDRTTWPFVPAPSTANSARSLQVTSTVTLPATTTRYQAAIFRRASDRGPALNSRPARR